MSSPDPISTVTTWIQESQRLVVLTGAGISAESGVPTFRGSGGLWRSFRAEDLATPEAFARDPRLVWEWYDWRRGKVAQTQPNPGHLALAKLERIKSDFSLITQNVDGLHDLAGSSRPLKLHGDIWELRCTSCSYKGVNRDVPLTAIPPRCECGSLLRPSIVWFGESLPSGVLEQAWSDSEQAELFLVVGTSALVHPAASMPLVAKRSGARVVEINLEPTAISDQVDISLMGRSGELLPQLIGV
jgi:NAD-dependent deacetylase